MGGPVAIEWSLDALADIDRFAVFLHLQFPEVAPGGAHREWFQAVGENGPREMCG